MTKVALLVLVVASLVLTACGGDDFTGSPGTPFHDAAVDALAETSPEAGNDGQGADSDAGTDAATVEADAAVTPDVAEASDEVTPEAGPDACVPGTCQTLGANCGSVPDGCGGTIPSCGTCGANESCGGGGVPHVCGGCVPDTCAAHNYGCGSMPDGCGNTVVCGPAFFNQGPGNNPCELIYPVDGGATYQTWYCQSYPNALGPAPFADCVPKPGIPLGQGYCCKEVQ
jgi:hypothetical protein